MSGDERTHLPEILYQHLDELEFAWRRRQWGLRSQEETIHDFWELEERLDAHADGLAIAGAAARPLLQTALESDDEATVFAGALPMLRQLDSEARSSIARRLEDTSSPSIDGLGHALAFGPLNGLESDLQHHFRTGPDPLAALCGEILAYHSALKPHIPEILRFLESDRADIRLRGWRLVGNLGVPIDARAYARAIRDPHQEVTRAALEAGSWCGHKGVLTYSRKVAATPRPENLDALYLLAVLGEATDLPTIATAGRCADLATERFRLLGAYGHPALMDFILEEMASPEPETAAAAGAAFSKITGEEVTAREQVAPHPDTSEGPTLDEIELPDPSMAFTVWEEMKPTIGNAPRLCRGFDMRRGVDASIVGVLDMESRWEAFVRARYYGLWEGSPLSLEVFPQTRSTTLESRMPSALQ